MNTNELRERAETRVMIPHDSPKIHPLKVKHETRVNAVYISKNNNSFSSFTYSPVPARATPARAYTRVCVRGGGERVKHGNGHCRPMPQLSRPDQAGPNSVRCGLTIQAQPRGVQRSRVRQAEPHAFKCSGSFLPKRQRRARGNSYQLSLSLLRRSCFS